MNAILFSNGNYGDQWQRMNMIRCINPKFEILTISWTRSGPSGHNKSIVRTKFCFSNVGSKKKDKMEIMSLLLTFYKIKMSEIYYNYEFEIVSYPIN